MKYTETKQKDRSTYRELDRSASAIAALLQKAGMSGEKAFLIYRSWWDFVRAFSGCLYDCVVVVLGHPPVTRQMMSIVEPIAKDAGL